MNSNGDANRFDDESTYGGTITYADGTTVRYNTLNGFRLNSAMFSGFLLVGHDPQPVVIIPLASVKNIEVHRIKPATEATVRVG